MPANRRTFDPAFYDLVLFEENGIRPSLPTVEKDLPGGARRLVQKAEGIKATLVNGAVAFENVEFRYPLRLDTAALNGFTLAVEPGDAVAARQGETKPIGPAEAATRQVRPEGK